MNEKNSFIKHDLGHRYICFCFAFNLFFWFLQNEKVYTFWNLRYEDYLKRMNDRFWLFLLWKKTIPFNVILFYFILSHYPYSKRLLADGNKRQESRKTRVSWRSNLNTNSILNHMPMCSVHTKSTLDHIPSCTWPHVTIWLLQNWASAPHIDKDLE